MQWVDPLHTVFAIGAKLGIVSLNPSDFTVQELSELLLLSLNNIYYVLIVLSNVSSVSQ